MLSSVAPVHHPGEENSCCEVGRNQDAPVDSESRTVSKDVPPVELVGGPPGVEVVGDTEVVPLEELLVQFAAMQKDQLKEVDPPQEVNLSEEVHPPQEVTLPEEVDPPKKSDPREEVDPPEKSDPREEVDPPEKSDPREEVDPPKKSDSREEVDPPKKSDPQREVDPPKKSDPREEVDPPEKSDPREEVDLPKKSDPRREVDLPKKSDPREEVDPPEKSDPREEVDLPEKSDPQEEVEPQEKSDPRGEDLVDLPEKSDPQEKLNPPPDVYLSVDRVPASNINMLEKVNKVDQPPSQEESPFVPQMTRVPSVEEITEHEETASEDKPPLLPPKPKILVCSNDVCTEGDPITGTELGLECAGTDQTEENSKDDRGTIDLAHLQRCGLFVGASESHLVAKKFVTRIEILERSKGMRCCVVHLQGSGVMVRSMDKEYNVFIKYKDIAHFQCCGSMLWLATCPCSTGSTPPELYVWLVGSGRTAAYTLLQDIQFMINIQASFSRQKKTPTKRRGCGVVKVENKPFQKPARVMAYVRTHSKCFQANQDIPRIAELLVEKYIERIRQPPDVLSLRRRTGKVFKDYLPQDYSRYPPRGIQYMYGEWHPMSSVKPLPKVPERLPTKLSRITRPKATPTSAGPFPSGRHDCGTTRASIAPFGEYTRMFTATEISPVTMSTTLNTPTSRSDSDTVKTPSKVHSLGSDLLNSSQSASALLPGTPGSPKDLEEPHDDEPEDSPEDLGAQLYMELLGPDDPICFDIEVEEYNDKGEGSGRFDEISLEDSVVYSDDGDVWDDEDVCDGGGMDTFKDGATGDSETDDIVIVNSDNIVQFTSTPSHIPLDDRKPPVISAATPPLTPTPERYQCEWCDYDGQDRSGVFKTTVELHPH